MKKWLTALMLVAVLAGCGGGGGDSTPTQPAQTASAEGMWEGTTSTGSQVLGFVLDDGTFYGVYTDTSGDYIEGIIQGSGSSSNGVYTTTNAKDYYFGADPYVENVTIAANYTSMQSLSGTVRYASNGYTITFSTIYDTHYDLTPSLSTLAGTYSGSIVTGEGTDSSTFTIAANGSVSGTTTYGCSFTGTAVPRSHGNVYNISIRMGSSPCAYPGQTLNGMAYYASDTGATFAAAPTSDRSGGFLFVGMRQ